MSKGADVFKSRCKGEMCLNQCVKENMCLNHNVKGEMRLNQCVKEKTVFETINRGRTC